MADLNAMLNALADNGSDEAQDEAADVVVAETTEESEDAGETPADEGEQAEDETTEESEDVSETPADESSEAEEKEPAWKTRDFSNYRCKYPANSTLKLVGELPESVKSRKHVHSQVFVSALQEMSEVSLGDAHGLIIEAIETDEHRKQFGACGFKQHVDYLVKQSKGAVELNVAEAPAESEDDGEGEDSE